MSGDDKMGVHLDGSYDGFSGRLEVIEGPTGRRQRSSGEKARIVAESLVPGVRVADVARKHGVTRWQVYDWRKQLRSGRLALPESVASMPALRPFWSKNR
jgi:transposase